MVFLLQSKFKFLGLLVSTRDSLFERVRLFPIEGFPESRVPLDRQ